jgi:hypothetical protein
MELRIQSNSVRVGMDRRDLTELLECGLVVGALRLGPGSRHTFTYAVMIGAAPPGSPRADYAPGRLVVTIDPVAAQLWAAGDRVGLDEEQDIAGGTVRVILEKDFVDGHRPAGDGARDPSGVPVPAPVNGQPPRNSPKPTDRFRYREGFAGWNQFPV